MSGVLLFSFSTEVHVDRIPSENEYLKPAFRRTGRRIIPYLFKTDRVKVFQKVVQQEVKTQLKQQRIHICDIPPKNLKVVMNTTAFISKNFNARDVDNATMKVYNDAFKRALDLDDNRSFTVIGNKVKSDTGRDCVLTFGNIYYVEDC